MENKNDNTCQQEVLGLDVNENDWHTTTVISFVSKNNKAYEVSFKDASISQFVKNAIEHEENKENGLTIPLDHDDVVVSCVVDYMKHHQGEHPEELEKPLKSTKMIDVCKDEFDAKLIDNLWDESKDQRNLTGVILAANYLDIHSLLDLGCAKLASLVKNKPLEEITKILGTENSETLMEQEKEQE